MQSKKLLQSILQLEKKIERINSFINFESIKAQGIIPRNVLDILNNLEFFKERINNNKYSEKEIIMLKIVIDEIKFYIDFKFSDYM